MSFPPPTAIASRPVTVIGAGTLGRRIALIFGTRGGQVRIHDLCAQQRHDAVAYVRTQLPAVAAKLEHGTPGTVDAVDDLAAAVTGAWLIVEAVPERLEVKRKVFADLDALADPDAILASNSSSYPSSQFLDHVTHPERVLNTHFYMPPTQNALELMSCGHTDRAVIDFLMTELPRYGLHPFEARTQSTGFILNRVWAAAKREALAVVADGVTTPQELDRMYAINLPNATGPFRMMDKVGLDVVLDIENHYATENPHLPTGPRELLHAYVDAGHLGVKTGRGFYNDYTTTETTMTAPTQTASTQTTTGVPETDYASAWAARSQEEFANTFADDIVFEVPMVMTRPVHGRENVAYLLGSVSKVYETQRFTHQATHGDRTYLDWELTIFDGEPMRGVTAFTRNDEGKITHLAVYHRPMLTALRMSHYAGQVMGERFGHDLFYSAQAVQAEIDKGGPQAPR